MDLDKELHDCLRLCREKTGARTTGELGKFLPDCEGFAFHHAALQSSIRDDPEWMIKFLKDEILIPSTIRSYPKRTRLNEKIRSKS